MVDQFVAPRAQDWYPIISIIVECFHGISKNVRRRPHIRIHHPQNVVFGGAEPLGEIIDFGIRAKMLR